MFIHRTHIKPELKQTEVSIPKKKNLLYGGTKNKSTSRYWSQVYMTTFSLNLLIT